MFLMPMVVIALWMSLAQAADESDQSSITFLYSLDICMSGPVDGRAIEVKSSKGEVIGRIEYETYGNAAVCEPTGSIEWLEIDVQFRRHGIGTLLFQTALDDMRNQGCKNVSWQSTKKALPFYKKQGATYYYKEYDEKKKREYHGMGIQTTGELTLPASRFRQIIGGD